jgi:phosphotransferase system enzyme I (PtsI)
MNEKVSHLYDYFHPSVLRLIKQVIDAAHEAGKWVGMCGQMASDPLATPVLLGMGLDEWSMEKAAVPEVKKQVRSLLKRECQALVEAVMTCSDSDQIKQQIKTWLDEKVKIER